VGAALLAVRVVREARRDDVFLLTVFAGGVLLALAQVRFVPYAAIAVAALAGRALGPWLGRAWRGEAKDTPRWLGRAVWPAAIAVGLVVPTWPFAWAYAQAPGTPREPWVQALQFLRERTPEPFGDAAAFERIVPRAGGGAAAPASSYGVLAWWDAGYWITQIARRVPLANPTQAGAGEAARFLLEEDPAEAAAQADALGARYVVLDAEMLVLPRAGALRGTLPSVAPWAGLADTDLVRSFRDRRPGDRPAEVVLFLPAYYRSQFVRLFLFGGRETSEGPVTGVVWRNAEDGVREVVDLRTFEGWEQAAAWRDSLPGAEVELGSADPLLSCVPLEAAPAFRLVGRSSTAAPILAFAPIWNVQVWERVRE
jgi:dolichyl-diphosphooligosaccharide--protein glycosyltransferase